MELFLLQRELRLGLAALGEIVDAGDDHLFALICNEPRRKGAPERASIGPLEVHLQAVHRLALEDSLKSALTLAIVHPARLRAIPLAFPSRSEQALRSRVLIRDLRVRDPVHRDGRGGYVENAA